MTVLQMFQRFGVKPTDQSARIERTAESTKSPSLRGALCCMARLEAYCLCDALLLGQVGVHSIERRIASLLVLCCFAFEAQSPFEEGLRADGSLRTLQTLVCLSSF